MNWRGASVLRVPRISIWMIPSLMVTACLVVYSTGEISAYAFAAHSMLMIILIGIRHDSYCVEFSVTVPILIAFHTCAMLLLVETAMLLIHLAGNMHGQSHTLFLLGVSQTVNGLCFTFGGLLLIGWGARRSDRL